MTLFAAISPNHLFSRWYFRSLFLFITCNKNPPKSQILIDLFPTFSSWQIKQTSLPLLPLLWFFSIPLFSTPKLFPRNITQNLGLCLLSLLMMLGCEAKSFKQVPLTYHHHHHHRRQVVTKNIPKGCLAIKVGQGEEQQRILIPVIYLNHPLFAQLLKEAEEEYGFAQQGTITIPCQVEEFKYVQDLIDRERSPQHHHQHHLVGCFRA